MFDLLDPQTFWLNVANIGLGIATLVICVVVVLSLCDDIAEHLKGTSERAVDPDSQIIFRTELGRTMADGGQRVEHRQAH